MVHHASTEAAGERRVGSSRVGSSRRVPGTPALAILRTPPFANGSLVATGVRDLAIADECMHVGLVQLELVPQVQSTLIAAREALLLEVRLPVWLRCVAAPLLSVALDGRHRVV